MSSPINLFLSRRMAVRNLTLLILLVGIITACYQWTKMQEDAERSPEQPWGSSVSWSDGVLKHLWSGKDAHLEKENDSYYTGSTTVAPNPPSSTIIPHDTFSSLPPADPRPHTKLTRHAPGWTTFENLYMSNGTLFIVTADPSQWPNLRYMISVPMIALNTPENIAAREPTPELISFITPEDAGKLWGDRVWEVKDWTFMVTDPPQFLDHYYHFLAETFLGFWRMFSSLDPKIDVHGNTVLPTPARIIIPYCTDAQWSDYSQFNQWFLHGVFPSLSIESLKEWDARRSMTAPNRTATSHQKLKAFRFTNLILSDRSATFRGNICPSQTNRIASEAYEATKNISSQWWWEPIRRSVMRFSDVEKDVMDRSVIWDGVWNWGLDVANTDSTALQLASKRTPVVVSYIVRISHYRMLTPESHRSLIESLNQLCSSKGWEFNVVHAERMTREEQVQMAAKSTIILGVHGNGLTHLVWMPPSPISTVIEIFYPGGFARDYEWTARALGHRHYGIWNDTYITNPRVPEVIYVEGFHGREIPVHGPTVAKLVEDRVEGRI
ncbi:hypothetical protein FRB95_010998 [Tulasnella sp. JGI-2019a]|nr:hypothetical protein FRB95_010998 [Tulasnella sp. JGI-2019a]